MSKRKKQPLNKSSVFGNGLASINLQINSYDYPLRTHVIRVQDDGLRLLTRMSKDPAFRKKVEKLLNS